MPNLPLLLGSPSRTLNKELLCRNVSLTRCEPALSVRALRTLEAAAEDMKLIVTGASKPNGIGFAIARKFLAADPSHRVVLGGRTPRALEARVRELERQFPTNRAEFFACDLSNERGATEFANFCTAAEPNGPVDVLVNNSGAYSPGSIATEAPNALEQMLASNLYGAYHLTRALLPGMKARGSGLVVNIASVASIKGFDNGGSYGIAKHALSGFSRNLREELKPFGIKVTTIYPGATATDAWDAEGLGGNRDRLMDPNNIADVVVAITRLSKGANVDEIIMRPQLGDL